MEPNVVKGENELSETQKLDVRGKTAAGIADSIRQLISTGDLVPGYVLPPVRELAGDLGVNKNTVASAYSALGAAGIVQSRGGRRGTVVARVLTIPHEGVTVPLGLTNLADGNPDPSLLPKTPSLTGYSTLLYGHSPISEQLRAWAERTLLSEVPGGTLVATHGAVDAIERLFAAQLTRGDSVAVEDPCFLANIGTLRTHGFSMHPVTLDSEGMKPEKLRQALEAGARAVVVTPRGQNPTGASLSEQRCSELAEVLTDFPDVLVIEDDPHSEIAVTPYRRITPVSTRRWALVRSLSKFISPDLRLSLMACDSDTATRLEARLSQASWVSHVLQHLAATTLHDPESARLFERARETYAARRTYLTSALAEANIEWVGGADGFNVWIPVIGDETRVVDALAERGWAVLSGSAFAIDFGPAIRVTTSTLSEEQAVHFVRDLSEIFHDSV